MSLPNVDTDMITPAVFTKTIERTGLGKIMFHRMRFNEDGSENSGFVLNQEPFRDAGILVAGSNFGCGSSREHAPWALLDFGIRCIISTSFADIFFNNAAKNGILLIKLPQRDVDTLMADAKQAATLTVDLAAQTIGRPDGSNIHFDVEPHRKHNLLNGIDEIESSLQSVDKIDAYERKIAKDQPWLSRRTDAASEPTPPREE